MNNEPVAWMIIDVDNGKSLQFEENKFSEINIPLYTAPRELSDEIEALKHDNEELLKSLTAERTPRQLSDEEIQTIDKLLDLCWNFSVSGVYFHEFQENVEAVEKVEAILKKASEK